MKVLLLLFSVAVSINGNPSNNSYSRVFFDCEHYVRPYIDEEYLIDKRRIMKRIHIYHTQDWNIKVYDKQFTYLNTSIKIDIADIVKGDYEIFSDVSRKTIVYEQIHLGTDGCSFFLWPQLSM